MPSTKRSCVRDGEVRKFGLLFSAVCALAGLVMLWKGGSRAWILFALAGMFLVTGLVWPRALRLFYVVWMRFAALLAWINTRVLLSALFFLVLTPVGLVFRLMGKDLLEQKIDRSKATYWVKRNPAEHAEQNYTHLF
jgi:hypothetical protein